MRGSIYPEVSNIRVVVQYERVRECTVSKRSDSVSLNYVFLNHLLPTFSSSVADDRSAYMISG